MNQLIEHRCTGVQTLRCLTANTPIRCKHYKKATKDRLPASTKIEGKPRERKERERMRKVERGSRRPGVENRKKSISYFIRYD